MSIESDMRSRVNVGWRQHTLSGSRSQSTFRTGRRSGIAFPPPEVHCRSRTGLGPAALETRPSDRVRDGTQTPTTGLYQVVALRTLGVPLARIARALEGDGFTLKDAVTAQLEAVDAELLHARRPATAPGADPRGAGTLRRPIGRGAHADHGGDEDARDVLHARTARAARSTARGGRRGPDRGHRTRMGRALARR